MSDEGTFHSVLRSATEDARGVLDVGGGEGHMRQFYPATARIFALDACATDLGKYPGAVVRFHGLAQDVLPVLEEGVFDVVLGLDFIEHLPLPEAKAVLHEMKRIAQRRVCLFVPEGEHPQAGTPENPFQEHRSTWNRGMLEELGFAVTVWQHFHSAPGKASGAMWATWARGNR